MISTKLTFAFTLLTASLCIPLGMTQTASGQVVETDSPVRTGTVVAAQTNNGLVSEITPQGFMIRTEKGLPVRYFNSQSTLYVDDQGRPVARELMALGHPVTIQFAQADDRLVADRVIVHRVPDPVPVREKQANPVASPHVVVEKPVVIEKPVVVEKTVPVYVERKIYVDRPVEVEKPVYVERKVVVEKPVIVEKPVLVEKRVPTPAVIEKKTTTTTTTTEGKKDKDRD